MPKRTNQFQKCINHILTELAPFGASVTESAEVLELELDGIAREVDTLVEAIVDSRPVRLAVETRDRGRKDDIEWIDSLIGKYKSLPIDRVLAISNSGFSASAKLKAEKHQIDVMSPQEIELTNWPAKFQKLGMALFEGQLVLESVEFETNPPFTQKPDGTEIFRHVDKENRTSEGTVKKLVVEITPTLIEKARNHFNKSLSAIYKSLEDMRKDAVCQGSVAVENAWLVVGSDSYKISRLKYTVIARGRVETATVKHQSVGHDALISSGHIGELSFMVAQTADSGKGRVFLRPISEKKKR